MSSRYGPLLSNHHVLATRRNEDRGKYPRFLAWIKVISNIGSKNFFLLPLIIVLTSCIKSGDDRVNQQNSTNIKVVSFYPYFIDRVYPYPESNITLKNYEDNISGNTDSGIVVSIYGYMDVAGFTKDKSSWKSIKYVYDNSHLYLDGMLIDDTKRDQMLTFGEFRTFYDVNSGEELYESIGPIPIYWRPQLTVGHHTAKYVLDKVDGTRVEMTWTFTVIP